MSSAARPPLVASSEEPARIPSPPTLWYVLSAASLLGASADPIFSQAVIKTTFNLEESYSWLVVAAIFATSVALAMKVGVQSVKNDRRTSTIILWIAMGLSMFLLRWFEKPLIADGDFSDFSPTAALPLALLMFVLYFASGAGIIWSATTMASSAYFSIQPSIRREKAATSTVGRALAKRNYAAQALEVNASELELWSQKTQNALTEIRNQEMLLKDVVRVRLSVHLASPRETILELPDPKRSRAYEPNGANLIKSA